MLVLQEGPRASQSSLLVETIPETQDVTHSQDISRTQDFSRADEVIIPRRTPTADPRPYLRLVDPAAVTLPLHSTSMDEASSVQVSLGTQYVSPVFGNTPYPAGQTLPTQAAESATRPIKLMLKIVSIHTDRVDVRQLICIHRMSDVSLSYT